MSILNTSWELLFSLKGYEPIQANTSVAKFFQICYPARDITDKLLLRLFMFFANSKTKTKILALLIALIFATAAVVELLGLLLFASAAALYISGVALLLSVLLCSVILGLGIFSSKLSELFIFLLMVLIGCFFIPANVILFSHLSASYIFSHAIWTLVGSTVPFFIVGVVSLTVAVSALYYLCVKKESASFTDNKQGANGNSRPFNSTEIVHNNDTDETTPVPYAQKTQASRKETNTTETTSATTYTSQDGSG